MKDSDSIFVTLSGIAISVKDMQLSNAELPMLVALPNIAMLVKDVQPSNAELSMLVPLVMTTFFKLWLILPFLFPICLQAIAGMVAVSIGQS